MYAGTLPSNFRSGWGDRCNKDIRTDCNTTSKRKKTMKERRGKRTERAKAVGARIHMSRAELPTKQGQPFKSHEAVASIIPSQFNELATRLVSSPDIYCSSLPKVPP